MTTITTEYEVQIIEAVTENSGSIEIVVDETQVIEVIEKGAKGGKGGKGEQGDAYEFVGGTEGQVWTVLPNNNYGWKETSNTEDSLIGFINQEEVSLSYDNVFKTRVYLLKKENVQGHSIVLNVNGESETYVTVGLFNINQQNVWSEESGRMAFKGETSNKYVVYDKTNNSWVIVDLGYPSIGEIITSSKIILVNDGMLPDSFGEVSIDVNFNLIPKTYFSVCEPNKKYITETNTLIISFAGTSQTGYVVL